MLSLLLDLRFRIKLQIIEDANPTAAAQGKSECCNSAVCCWRRPGALHPDDLPKIAAFLGKTEKEVFQTLMVVDEFRNKLVVLPRRVDQKHYAGKYLPMKETYSISTPCVFLDNNKKCSIHDVKPQHCREFKCWDSSSTSELIEWPKELLMSLGWDGNCDE